MARQTIDFEHGGPLTGDSGERGNSSPGIASVKPYADGERAVAATFDRPIENLRQRTEVLREETEGGKYLQDGDMRWVLSSGKADGLHDPGTAWPTIATWAQHPSDPALRWRFTLTPGTSVVVQPLNTPSTDLQESLTWDFPVAGPVAATVTAAMNLRDYSGANLRRVIWQAIAPASIVGTHGVAQYCDLELSGEANHILTITIRNDDLTQLAQITTAFAGYAASLVAAGLDCSTAGVNTTPVTIADIPDTDYTFAGTFERELHYIQAATFVNFFAVESPPGTFPNCLADGDTLAIVWSTLVSDVDTTGRRQACPANIPDGRTEVLYGQLFKTSDHPEWIPLAIPLCKRVKNELLWLDGTLITDGQTTAMGLRFGENGFTVKRIYDAPGTIPLAATAEAHESAGFYNVPVSTPLDTVVQNVLSLLNDKASLNLGTMTTPEPITGAWDYTTTSRIQIASSPANFVIEGLYALGPHATDPLLPTAWTENYMLFGAGRAIVNGKPIIKASPTAINDLHNPYMGSGGTHFMQGVTLPVDDTVADTYLGTPGVPGWYYVWLRSDGTFFVGKLPPIGEYALTGCTPGTVLYRPTLSEVHTGGSPAWTQADYVLVDVIVLMEVRPILGGPYLNYFDNAPYVGGDLRKFRHRLLNATLTDHISYRFDLLAASPIVNEHSTYYNGSSAGWAWIRCPSIPLGVTSRARVLYHLQYSVIDSVSEYVELILHGGDLINPILIEDVDTALGAGMPTLCKRWYSGYTGADYVGLSGVESGVVDITLSPTAGHYGNMMRELNHGTDSGGIYSAYITGFYWTRGFGTVRH
jgi:hypothetical protein